MCEMARDNRVPTKLIGRPKAGLPESLPSPGPLKICKRCYQPVGKGISHPQPCGKRDRRDNIKESMDADPRAAEVLASKLIAEKASSSTQSTIQLASDGPRPLSIQVEKKKPNRALFPGDQPVSTEQFSHLSNTLNLSLNQAKKAATIFRTWKGRKSIEAGVVDSMRAKDKDLEDFFDIQTLQFALTGGETVNRDVVYCVNVEGLIDYLLEERKVEGDHTIKIGMDGGGSFLKICMNIMVKEEDQATSKRMKYSEGAFSKDCKSGSVKKLIILALCEDIPENYENLKSLMALIGLNKISFINALDMKLALILFGLSGATATYPCVWCDMNKNMFKDIDRKETRELRTIGSIRDNAEKYQKAAENHKGATKLSAAPFKSCQHDPLIDMPDSTVILDILPPMELHLLLGIVNRLFNELDLLLKAIPGSKVCANDWSQACGLVRPKLHGGEFPGNSCKTLLNSIDKLEDILPKDVKETVKVQRLVKALKDFKEVKDSCFGKEVDSAYKVVIREFEKSYRNLDISVTPKVHAVIDHLEDFFERQPDETGLGHHSEQASEAVHSDFTKLWTGAGYKRETIHPDYSKNILKCVIVYNSRHK